jgi:hypothetical protein
MRRPVPLPSVSTRTSHFAPRELEFVVGEEDRPRPAPAPRRETGERIRDALKRWFEEEL